MSEITTYQVGRKLTAAGLCSIMLINTAMYGCAGAPDGGNGPNPGDASDPSALPPRAQAAQASKQAAGSPAATAATGLGVGSGASLAVVKPVALSDLTSRFLTDSKGQKYETKFQGLANQLLLREAQSKENFEAVLEKAFGANFDRAKAETIRQQILKGDYSWAPKVRIVDDATLNGMLGAYAAKTGTVYLSRSVPSKFERTFIYIEELGHHLDTLLNTSDAPGDEGALFRVALTKEAVATDMIALMKSDNHVGQVLIDGQAVDVEFLWGIDWLIGAANAAWNGIKSGANYVWKGATTAGSAIKTAATKTWDGATTLSGWIAKGADVAADAFVSSLNRDYWAAYQAVNGAANAIITAGYSTVEGMKVIQQGLTEISKGNFLDGTAVLFTGLAKIAVEMPLDTLSTAVMDAIGVLQTALFLEPVGRYLNQRETDIVNWVFGAQWWVPYIRIKEGFAGIFSANPRPFTNQFNIYLKNWTYSEGLVVHETTHVWQFANGGGDYKLDSLYQQYVSKVGYPWEGSVNAGVQWENLPVEQQASFIESAWNSKCYDNYDFNIWAFTTCNIGGVDRLAYFNGVDQKIWAGVGAP